MVLGTFWGAYHDLITLLVTTAVAVAALLVAWAQARNGRLLELHEKLTTSDIGTARHKLAAHLYETNPAFASRINWADLQTFNLHTCPKCHTSLDDAYALLWFFQRMNRAVRSPVLGFVTGLVPYGGAKAMLDWHIVWWAIAFENVTVRDAWFSTDLQTLSKKIDPKREVYARAVLRFAPNSSIGDSRT